jgi:hypothetical protein
MLSGGPCGVGAAAGAAAAGADDDNWDVADTPAVEQPASNAAASAAAASLMMIMFFSSLLRSCSLGRWIRRPRCPARSRFFAAHGACPGRCLRIVHAALLFARVLHR